MVVRIRADGLSEKMACPWALQRFWTNTAAAHKTIIPCLAVRSYLRHNVPKGAHKGTAAQHPSSVEVRSSRLNSLLSCARVGLRQALELQLQLSSSFSELKRELLYKVYDFPAWERLGQKIGRIRLSAYFAVADQSGLRRFLHP